MSAQSRLQRNRLIQQAEGYLELGMPRHALDAIAELALTQTLDGQMLYLRGEAFRALGRFSEAAASLEEAAGLLPPDMHVQLALAWCYKRVQRLDLAIETLEDALEIEGDSARRRGILHYNLACYWSLANNVGLTLAHISMRLTAWVMLGISTGSRNAVSLNT